MGTTKQFNFKLQMHIPAHRVNEYLRKKNSNKMLGVPQAGNCKKIQKRKQRACSHKEELRYASLKMTRVCGNLSIAVLLFHY